MRFIIVADEELAHLGRQLAHAFSNQKAHTGAFWSVKHYKDNEAQLDGKQPVIFLGDHALTKSYVNVLPERFRRYGTRCHHEGSKAVLIADTPSEVSITDLKELQAALDQSQEVLRRRGEAARAEEGAEYVTAGAFASGVGLALWASGWGLIVWAIMKHLSAKKRRQEYSTLQYNYLLARFLVDEFERYVTGIEKR